MDAYNRLEKKIEKNGISKTSKKNIDSLVRLKEAYKDSEMEQIITQAMKANIFLYVFFPKHSVTRYPEKYKITCPAKWMAISQEDVSFILSDKKNNTAIIMGCKFGIGDLWISKTDADHLLKKHACLNSNNNIPKKTPGPDHKNDPAPTTKKRQTERKRKFHGLVNYLIEKGYTKKTFRDAITTTYLNGKNGLSDDEKFNQYDEVTHIYTVKNNVGKYYLHFSFVNGAGDPMPQKLYALDTVDNIFDEVIQLRRKKASTTTLAS